MDPSWYYTYLFFLVLFWTSATLAFHTGAPENACDSMTPGHGPPPQTSKSPYRVIMQKTDVAAGEQVDILLTAPSAGPPFKGFFIQVHPRNGDQAVGEFDPNSDENAQPVTCNGKPNSAMTHKDLDPKVQVKLKWTPPGEGEYVPVVTWVKQQDTFWVKEMPDGKTIKVSGGSDSSGGSARAPGSAAEEAKPKQEGAVESNKSGKDASDESTGQSHAISSLNNPSFWNALMAILFSGTLIYHRLF